MNQHWKNILKLLSLKRGIMVDGCKRLQAYALYLFVIFAYIIEMSLMIYPLIFNTAIQ